MINKQSTLFLGGKERTLLFSSLGILEYIQEQTGKDPFEWLKELQSNSGMQENGSANDVLGSVKNLRVVIYGAINCYNDSIDEERIPFEKINKWSTVLSEKQYAEVLNLFVSSIFNKTEAGEAAAPVSGA